MVSPFAHPINGGGWGVSTATAKRIAADYNGLPRMGRERAIIIDGGSYWLKRRETWDHKYNWEIRRSAVPFQGGRK